MVFREVMSMASEFFRKIGEKEVYVVRDDMGRIVVSDELFNELLNNSEKQIPKKPLAYDDCEQYLIRCTCGKPTDTRFFHGYCTWCGQKLDK